MRNSQSAQFPDDGHWPSVVLQSGKSSRTAITTSNDASKRPQIIVKPGDHLDRLAMQASLTPQKLTDLLRHELHTSLAAVMPSRQRFHGQEAAHERTPSAERFGPQVAETDRSSRLALALSSSAEVELAAFRPTAGLLAARPDGIYVAPQEILEASLDTGGSILTALPGNIPLPTIRPTIAEARISAAPSVAVAKSAPSVPSEAQELAKAPVKDDANDEQHPSEANKTLAYAKPDNPVSSLGQAFKNLFSHRPRRNGGVAVYDISAHTVYMPDGSQLEAHSGLGKMVDDPRYVKVKNRGPTPPNTYKLVMRESLFHGVEAIRLLPVDGKNKFNRDGLLAHTYMLRGGLEQSNGCVVFEHYGRFLKAFKKGKIKKLVVVPGNGKGETRIASYGRGA